MHYLKIKLFREVRSISLEILKRNNMFEAYSVNASKNR